MFENALQDTSADDHLSSFVTATLYASRAEALWTGLQVSPGLSGTIRSPTVLFVWTHKPRNGLHLVLVYLNGFLEHNCVEHGGRTVHGISGQLECTQNLAITFRRPKVRDRCFDLGCQVSSMLKDRRVLPLNRVIR